MRYTVGCMAQFGLSTSQQEYVDRVRGLARGTLADIPATAGRVNRPLLRELGRLGLLRGLFGGAPGEPVDTVRGAAAAMQLCLR